MRREGLSGWVRSHLLLSGLAYVILAVACFAMVLVGHKSADSRIALTAIGLLFFLWSGFRFWMWRTVLRNGDGGD